MAAPPAPALPTEELRALFPGVRWEHVTFHAGLPWLGRVQGVHAMVLPCAWHPRRVHVHLGDADLATPAGRARLVHECVHVRQYQDLGPGLGCARPFTFAYLAWAPWRGTGRAHPLEAPAYGEDVARRARFGETLAGRGARERILLPARLLVGLAATAAALVLGPLVEGVRCPPRAPPP